MLAGADLATDHDRNCRLTRGLKTREYGFYAGHPSEIDSEDLHGDLVIAFSAPTSVSSTGQASISGMDVLGPDLVVVRHGSIHRRHNWDAYDSARMALFAAERVVRHFAVKYPGYTRLEATLLATSRALHSLDADAVAAANRAGKQLSSIACRSDETQQLPAGDVGLLLGIAGAARAAAWDDHGQRAYWYVCNALDAAVKVDRRFPELLELWLDLHLRTRL